MKTTKIIFLLTCLLHLNYSIKAQNYQLVWADEFTNGIGGDWIFETGRGSNGWGNNELQFYRTENASVQNGQLVLTAKREDFGGANYTSVRMKTQGKKSWKYGKIEARIAMPSFQGVWPAFWMLGDNISSVGWPSCGEIDIMEHVNTGGEVVGTIHWANASGVHAEYGGRTSTNITAFHTYAIEWNANSIKWFVDGSQYHEVNIANGVNSTNELHNNFFILLNLAIGGNWPGFAVDNNAFPAKMFVDYVRVYQDNGLPPTPPAGSSASVYKHCDFGGYAIGLPEGDYNYGALYARGVANEDISSLKVNSGYQIQLFEHDDFTGTSITLTGEDNCLVNEGWNDRTTSLKIKKTSQAYSKTIQAENYSAMIGVQNETTTDAGGGLNVGYIDNGEWMAYNTISFPTSGTYLVEYRVASLNGGKLSLDLNAGSVQLGTVTIPATGGWQNWTTVSHQVNINAGTYNVGLFAQTGGWNINWFRFTKVGNGKGNAFSSVEIEDNDYATTNTITLSPNPAGDYLLIEAPFNLEGGEIQIINSLGKEVLRKSISTNQIDISKLDAGIYSILYSIEGNKISSRFVKK